MESEPPIKLSDVLKNDIITLKMTCDEALQISSFLFSFIWQPMMDRQLRYRCAKFYFILDMQMHKVKKCTAELEDGNCHLLDNFEQFKEDFRDMIRGDVNAL